MKTLFVKDLTADQSITTFFLVHEKEIRNTTGGKPYLRMELGDDAVGLMSDIKRALDPHNLMNPGKVVARD